jgi:hypothetical protein
VTIHLILSVFFLFQASLWTARGGAKLFVKELTKAPQIVMPLASLAMSLNVFLGPVRNLVPGIDAYAEFWQPASIVLWILVAGGILTLTAGLVFRLFREVPREKPLGYVWLFPALALGLTAASGAFLASLANLPLVAYTAGFGAAVVLLAGLIFLALLGPRVTSSRKKGHVSRGGYYSFFNLVPTAALFAIAFAHGTGFTKKWLGLDLSAVGTGVVMVAWIFGLIYALFIAVSLLSAIKSDLKEKQYFGNQWALTCVPVAWSVLTTLLQETLVPSLLLLTLSALVFLATLPMAFILGKRLLICLGLTSLGAEKVACS